MKSSFALVALVPTEVVTVTFTVPTEPAGDSATITCESSARYSAEADPNFTELTLVKFVPRMNTRLSPVTSPLFGNTRLTVGDLPGRYRRGVRERLGVARSGGRRDGHARRHRRLLPGWSR